MENLLLALEILKAMGTHLLEFLRGSPETIIGVVFITALAVAGTVAMRDHQHDPSGENIPEFKDPSE